MGMPQPIAQYPHRIIDLRGETGDACYRLFNSGNTKILIQAGKANPIVDIASISKGQSFDFQVPTTDNRAVFVRGAKDDGTVDDKLPIKGIYHLTKYET